LKRLVCRVLAVITAAVASMLNAPVALAATGEQEGFTPIAQTTQVGERSQAEVDAEFAAIITDLVGTPIRLLDANGATTWTNQASTWGATDANTAMPLRFAGQYHDTETGLHYNLNRYYNPDTGRYITTDPLGLTPSPNPHTYVPNPTTTIDPLGLNSHGVNTRAPWTLTREGASEVKQGGPFKTTFYKSASDGTWWTRDVKGHGGSAFKVYRETSSGLEWIKDADEFGDYISGKWKGSTGYSIPWSSLGRAR
jgi:RHS repeat-associated protein